MKPVNVEDYRQLARRRLPKLVFDYLDGGAGDERTLRGNRAAFERIAFKPHHLRDVSRRDGAIELFGRDQKLPLVLAPTGLNGCLWPDGDLLLARAAERAGIPFVLSTASNLSIEDLARRAGGDLWFQLYVLQRALAADLVRRARDAGYRVLVLTIDVPVNGRRERDLRNSFAVPFRLSPRIILDAALHPGWTLRQLSHGLPQFANLATPGLKGADAQAALMRRQMDASFTWDDLKALRDTWPGPLVVKGIMNERDALRCAELGIDGVILSNHGGRQLDDVGAPVDLVQRIAPQTPMPVLIDSGIKRGSDVVKALALGAKAVLLGRATLFALAAHGEKGVDAVLDMFRAEIDTTLALLGCATCRDLNADYIARTGD